MKIRISDTVRVNLRTGMGVLPKISLGCDWSACCIGHMELESWNDGVVMMVAL